MMPKKENISKGGDSMKQKISRKQRKHLLYAQQGELDAVLMYERLAKRVRHQRDAEAFRRLAADENRHASVFFELTGKTLKPRKTKAVFVPLLYTLIGRKKLYPIIAKNEYSAAEKYEGLIGAFPQVERVKNDETHHGDAVLSLLK